MKKIKTILKSSLNYKFLSDRNFSCDENYKFYGKFEGFEDNDSIWLVSENFTVRVKLKNTKIFYIPNIDEDERNKILKKREQSYKILRWSSMNFLTSGLKFYVCGKFIEESGLFSFLGQKEDNLVLIYDCNDVDVVQTSLFQIKDKFIFLKGFSLMSIMVGIMILFLYLIVALII